jgi:hypothetical protein
MVLAVFLFTALSPDDDWAASVIVLLLGATLVCALWTSGAANARSHVNVALVTLATVVACVNFVPSQDVRGAVGVFEALLTLAVGFVIGRGVVDQGEVNLQSVRGAIAIYVLLGLLFTFLYGAVVVWGPTLFAQGTDATRPVRLYFSYVTLTTLGYGDYAPAGTVAHTLAIVEALVGQLYLVTIVALLVSRLHTRADD